jgi:predicted transcriptional regulator
MSEEKHASVQKNLVRTTDIVVGLVANQTINAADLPGVIGAVYAALAGLDQQIAAPAPELVPAVPIKKSVTADFIICLDDGKKLKSMKRHLASLGMTPDAYRSKWGLPADYPMVARNYTATRSALAIRNGLGRRPSAAATPAKPASAAKKPARGKPAIEVLPSAML